MKRFALPATLGLFGATIFLAACGGGGGSSPSGSNIVPSTNPTTAPKPTPSPTAAPASTMVQGTVVQIPVDGFGPYTYMGTTYASADSSSTTPLAGATVVVGPNPVIGATLPATLPQGDVVATTNAAGAFSIAVPGVPYLQSAFAPVINPSQNITGYVAPVTGFYITVFGLGADGISAGKSIPLHTFRAIGSPLNLRLSTTSAAEAAALAALNVDRAANGAAALTFDESAQEAARLHATDEVNQAYYCHYDTKNAGPASRYLNVGGLGQTNENLAAFASNPAVTPSVMFAGAESQFMAEKSTLGGHYINNVDPSHVWAGLAAINGGTLFQATDYELVDPNGVDQSFSPTNYPVTNYGCPAGTVGNFS